MLIDKQALQICSDIYLKIQNETARKSTDKSKNQR